MPCAAESKKIIIFQNTSIVRSFMKKKTKEIHGQIIYGSAFCLYPLIVDSTGYNLILMGLFIHDFVIFGNKTFFFEVTNPNS